MPRIATTNRVSTTTTTTATAPVRFATYGTGLISDMMTEEQFHSFMQEWNELRNRVTGLRDKLVKLGPGKYAFGTVYRVGETTVRAHKRRAYKAVRLHIPKA